MSTFTLLVERLDEALASLKEAENRRLAGMPLEQERVDEFVAAFRRESGSPTSLSRLLIADRHQIPPDSPVQTFGGRIRVPKDYFVTTQVHASPSMLAETIARSVCADEDRLALQNLRDHAQVERCTKGDVERRVSSWTKSAELPLVVIIDSYHLERLLAVAALFDSDKKATFAQVYGANIDAKVALIDLARCPLLLRQPGDGANLVRLEHEGLAVGVQELPDQSAEDGSPLARIEIRGQHRWTTPDGQLNCLFINVNGVDQLEMPC